MRAEKQFLTDEYVERLNESPFFIATEYKGITVAEFEDLRGKLRGVNAEIHVVKNSVFVAAAAEAGVGELKGTLSGQLAIITGEAEISAAAKVVKEFAENAEKPKIRFGFVGERLEADAVFVSRTYPPSRCCAPSCWASPRRRHPVGPRGQHPGQRGGPGHPGSRGQGE